MINEANLRLAASIIDPLPPEKGTVSFSERKDPSGETQRVWSVEFSNQTILLEFVFDDSEKRERAFAELLAYGSNLLVFFARGYSDAELEVDSILGAFEIVFNATMRQYREAVSMIPKESIPDDDIPTVGEYDG